MSLIQQALEKTSRSQETQTTTPALEPKTWERDPMGMPLERELIQIQEEHVKRRVLLERVFLTFLFLGLVGCIVYYVMRSHQSTGMFQPSMTEDATVSPLPLKISSGTIYRLTGITNGGGRSVAVINERIVGVGDVLSGNAVVKAIGSGEVRLDIQGQEVKLTL